MPSVNAMRARVRGSVRITEPAATMVPAVAGAKPVAPGPWTSMPDAPPAAARDTCSMRPPHARGVEPGSPVPAATGPVSVSDDEPDVEAGAADVGRDDVGMSETSTEHARRGDARDRTRLQRGDRRTPDE